MAKLWLPPINQKQLDIFNNYKRFLLVSGPRRSSKTVGVCHKLCRHCWDTDRARASIFTKTIKVAKDGGCWTDLTENVIPIWISSGIGMDWVTRPKVDGTTRQHFCEVTNRHGTVSRIVLNSVSHDHDVEELTKGKRFSLVWLNELSNFRSRKVFDATEETLRMFHLPREAHQWIADTNPSDEGEDSWIWKLFYLERIAEDFPDYLDSDQDKENFRQFQRDASLIEIMIPDNPYLSESDRNGIAAKYRSDPDLYARYVLGKWTASSENSHFTDVFKPEIHIIGNTDNLNPENWEILLPPEDCQEMLTGWDLGSVNHAVHIIDPTSIGGLTVYKVLDELVLLNENIGLADIAEAVVEMMDYWESVCGRKLYWKHWSDKSSLDHFRPAAEVYDHNIIHSASDGRITLMGAPKYKDSVKHRVNLVRRLLFEDRLLISAKCHYTIQMLRGLRKGSSAIHFVDKRSPWKHPFDSLTYAISAETPLDFKEEKSKVGRPIIMA